MKKVLLTALITFSLIIGIQNWTVIYADEAVPSLIPTPAVSPTPSDFASTTASTPTPSASTPTPSTSPAPMTPQPTSSPTSTPIPTPTAAPSAALHTTNQVTHSNTVTISANTGENKASSSAKTEVTTAPAQAKIQTTTLINTTVIGTRTMAAPIALAEPASGTVSLVHSPMQPLSSLAIPDSSLSNSNHSVPVETPAPKTVSSSATLTNDLTVTAKTGDNQASGEAALVKTGDAKASAQLTNVLNTTLVGDCGYFGIINVFAEHTGDLLLPNQEEYLHCQSSSPELPTTATVTNQATLDTIASASAVTGENTTTGKTVVQTGNAVTNTQEIDHVNTTFMGNDWWLVRITNLQYWQGMLLGASDAQLLQDGSTLYIGNHLPIGSNAAATAGAVKITNTAEVTNTITAKADTGSNTLSADTSQLQTGTALANIQLINYLNTTVIGSRWLWADVNLLAPYSGQIVLAKPDLSVTSLTPIIQSQVGQRRVVGFSVQNLGQSSAQNLSFTVHLPKDIHALLSEPTTSISGSDIHWQLSSLSATASQNFYLLIETPVELANAHITAQVNNEFSELQMGNNEASALISVFPIVTVTQTQVIVVTPAPTPLPINRQVIKYKTVQAHRPAIFQTPKGAVLGKHIDAVLASVPVVPQPLSTAAKRQSICVTNPSICQNAQYVAAGGLGFFYLLKRKNKMKLWLGFAKR